MKLQRKTFTLSDDTILLLDTIVADSAKRDVHLTESILVRLALREGLPVIVEKLNLDGAIFDDKREIAVV